MTDQSTRSEFRANKTRFSRVRVADAAIALACLIASEGPGWAADAEAREQGFQAPARNIRELAILGPNYPRVFFFRSSEGGPSRPGVVYERWESEFNRLAGIMGKCLDEEVLGREARNPEFFSRFKQRQPQQVVLLHFNGNSRDPRHHTQPYFPGHWIYRRATRIVGDVPAEAGETVIHVEDTSDFKVNTGRYQTSNDDLGLFGITADGKHDWSHGEHVQLVSIDPLAKTIRVKRGCYGTQPLAFPAGRSRAAAHAVEGPWGRTNNLLWFYNHAAHCPRDAQGRTCGDLLVDDLAAWFGAGGKLAALDGLEFDVLFNETHGDTDGDGELDHGVIGDLNGYGIGVVEFVRTLRTRMGDDFIIQADGALGPGGVRSQRAWGLLNGIESEGWPNLNQWEMDDWSGGLNRHFFWRDNARPPVFNYINHKWTQGVPGQPGVTRAPEVPFARHRLVFAAAQFTDAMLCYSLSPQPEDDGRIGIWDEFRCGTDGTLGWLGRPLEPAVRLAADAPDLLAGVGTPAGFRLAEQIRGPAAVGAEAGSLLFVPSRARQPVAAEGGPVGTGGRLAPRPEPPAEVVFSLPDLPTGGSELTVFVTMKAEPRRGYPREMARLVQCEVSGGETRLLERQPSAAGMILRGQPAQGLDRRFGARVDYRPNETIGDTSLEAYAIHPPYLGGRGAVYWTRDVDVPREAELRFQLGMAAKSPERSDGIWFQVRVAELRADQAGEFRQIFETSTKAHQWLPQSVPLADWAGQRVRLQFVADCGPQDNATTDQGFWGDVRIVKAGVPEAAITPARSYMSWANDRSFTSAFYFRDIRSPAVDLKFTIEGDEPVTLEKISAHAHPDALVRRFEHGIVLANPSRQPYAFDLDKLSPGVRYRRIQATPNQDTQVNNGRPVAGVVTLDERDALFLVRVR